MIRPSQAFVSRPWLSAGLSGCLASFAFPNHQFPALILVALIPLLLALGACTRPAQAFRLGWIWGLGFFGILIYWIPEVMVQFGHLDRLSATLIYLMLVSALSMYPALFGVLVYCARLRWADGWWLAVPFAWVGVEWMRNFIPAGGFPWGQLGYAMTPCLGFLQLASITGIYGPTWMVVLSNTLAAWRLSGTPQTRGRMRVFWAGALLLTMTWIVGWAYLTIPSRKGGDPAVRVAVLQGNIAFDNDLNSARDAFQQFYYPETRKAFDRGIGLVVWPESPTPYSFTRQEAYRQELQQLLADRTGELLFNDIAVEEQPDANRYFNSALLLREAGRLSGRYDKQHLVPYGEYIPLAAYLPFIEALTREVGTFTPGTRPGLLPAANGPAGAFICYEAAFPDLVRQATASGARWLVNLTNDAWYGKTAAPYQHLQIATVRAIENRRYLLRAANSGLSAIINPQGVVVAQTGLFRKEILEGEIFSTGEISCYARWGDFFPCACVIITLVWLGAAVVCRMTGAKHPEAAR